MYIYMCVCVCVCVHIYSHPLAVTVEYADCKEVRPLR